MNSINRKSTEPRIEFTPKREAYFECPNSLLQKFKDFLGREGIDILQAEQPVTGTATEPEPTSHIEVSNVDDEAESKELITKFMAKETK
jgi:hypothetical protein